MYVCGTMHSNLPYESIRIDQNVQHVRLNVNESSLCTDIGSSNQYLHQRMSVRKSRGSTLQCLPYPLLPVWNIVAIYGMVLLKTN